MAVIPHSRCQTGDGEQQCVFANRFSAIQGEQEKTFAEIESIVYASGKKKKTDKRFTETLQQEVKNRPKLLINVLYTAQYGIVHCCVHILITAVYHSDSLLVSCNCVKDLCVSQQYTVKLQLSKTGF